MSIQTKIKAVLGRETYTSRLTMRGHELLADEPLENGGKDAGPTPTELILSGLASCTAATLRMYADRKGWDVDQIVLELTIRIDKTTDGQTAHIEDQIEILGKITDEQKERMLEIARKCPVHKLLTNPIEINTHLKP